MAKIRFKFGLTAKTFLAIFTACLLVLAVNGIASRVAFQTGFLDYLNDQGDLRMQRVMPHLQREYRTQGGWEHLRGDSDRWARLLRPDLGHGHEGPVPPLSDQTGVPSRLGLFDAQHRFVAGTRTRSATTSRTVCRWTDTPSAGWAWCRSRPSSLPTT